MKFKICITISILFVSFLVVFPSEHQESPLNILIVVDEEIDKFSSPQNDAQYLLEIASLFKQKLNNVEILFTQHAYKNDAFTDFKTSYLPELKEIKIKGSTPKVHKFFKLYRYLKNKKYDLIIYRLSDGWGYYLTQAKSQGYGFENTTLMGILTPIKDWKWFHNNETPYVPDAFIEAHLEDKNILFSDIVLYPSEFSLGFLKNHLKISVEDSKFIRFSSEALSVKNTDKQKAFEELIYIGDSNFVNGSDLFFKAIQKIYKSFPELFKKLKISILIPENNEIVLPKDLKRKIQILRCKNTDDVKKYLNQGNKLIAITSRSQWYATPSYYYDNHNEVIDFGGFPSNNDKDPLIDKLQQNFFNISDLVKTIHEKISSARKIQLRPEKDKFFEKDGSTYSEIMHIHKKNIDTLNSPKEIKTPLISVCVTHYNRTDQLMELLKSLEKQTYKNFELFIIDDESTAENIKILKQQVEPYLTKMGWKIIYQKNQDAQSARNSVSLHAKGEYIIFKDDDDIALPDELERLNKIAQKTDSDVVVTNIGVATESKHTIDHLYLWFGDAALPSMLGGNYIGGVKALIKKDLFTKVGGVFPQYRACIGDYITLIKALNYGAKITSSIEPTYIYNFIGQDHKLQDEAQTDTYNHITASYAFSKFMPHNLRHAPLMMHAQSNQMRMIKNKSKPSYWIRKIKRSINQAWTNLF